MLLTKITSLQFFMFSHFQQGNGTSALVHKVINIIDDPEAVEMVSLSHVSHIGMKNLMELIIHQPIAALILHATQSPSASFELWIISIRLDSTVFGA
jgi:hypothetical protein